MKKRAKKLKLPKPLHPYGYTTGQLIQMMSASEFRLFGEWINGQTGMLDPQYGCITYTTDVERFLNLKRHGVPTYWD